MGAGQISKRAVWTVKTGIVVALPEELSTLTSARIDKGHCAIVADNLVVALSGAGPYNAARTAGLLIEQGARRLLSWGCAAALEPKLQPGDLVLADSLYARDKKRIHCDPDWIEQTARILRHIEQLRIGGLACSASIVSTHTDKQTLYEQTRAIAVDMESYAVAETARRAAIPCIALKAVADPAATDLPEAVVHALNPQGEIDKIRLFGHILTHPFELPGLIALGKQFYTARNSLKLISHYLDKISSFNPIPRQEP